MREADYGEFSALLDATCRLVTRGTYTPDAQNTALFFRALATYQLAEVRAAFDAHIRDPQRGRFAPVPADLIAQIVVKGDGRPAAEEAWAIALKGRDEAETVVWTQEIAKAWLAAREVLDLGDEVGARMAFREVYERLVGESRQAGAKVEWRAMLGHDANRREEALQAAVVAGLLERTDVRLLGYDSDARRENAAVPQYIVERLAEIRAALAVAAPERATSGYSARAHGGEFRPIPRDALLPGMRPSGEEGEFA